MARQYAITSLDEARAYLAHPVLGPRLAECAGALLALDGLTAQDVLGGVDAMKLRSSVTLFQAAAPDVAAFGAVLAKYFDDRPDEETLSRL
jgi:uncharacterized protein (DUF1810 family)